MHAQADSADALRGHGGAIRAIALLANGDLVSGGFDSAIIHWDVKKGAAKRVLRHHDSAVNALAALSDTCFASGGEDGRVALWCGEDQPRHVLKGHSAPVSALLYLPRLRLLASAAWDRTIRLWDIESGRTAAIIEGHDGPVAGIAVGADGVIVSVGFDGQLRLTRDGTPAGSRRFDAPLNAVATLADGTIVTAGADGRVRLFDGKLQPAGEIDLGNGPLNALALSPDGATIAVAGIRTQVTLIAHDGPRISGEILGPGLPVWALAFSGDGGELFSGGADRALRRWDARTARPSGRDIAAPAPAERLSESEEGARVFRACRACHALNANDNSRAGPSLHGIVGRRIASAPGYVYSDALRRLDIVWSKDNIARLFEIGPNAFLPGTKMPEQTIPDEAARRALVDWLEKQTR